MQLVKLNMYTYLNKLRTQTKYAGALGKMLLVGV